jgi:AcrR family transcriptional regulator
LVAGRRQRLSAEERRGRILQGALEVFAERGYQEASMAAIATAAGITPAVIYDHFSSKAALHMTLLESHADKLLTSVGSALARAPVDLEERLRVGVDAFFAFVEHDGFAWWLLFRDPPTDPAVAAAYERIQRGATNGIAAFIRDAAPRKLRDQPDAERDFEMFAQLLRTAQNGLAAWWYEHHEIPREVLVDRVVEFCWVGLERVAAGERVSAKRQARRARTAGARGPTSASA